MDTDQVDVDMKDLMFDYTKTGVKDGEIGDGISPTKKPKKKKEDPIEVETQRIKARKIL